MREVANPNYRVKASKLEAEYDEGPNRREPCHSCTMFRKPASCTEVAGNISPYGHCKWFDRKQ